MLERGGSMRRKIDLLCWLLLASIAPGETSRPDPASASVPQESDTRQVDALAEARPNPLTSDQARRVDHAMARALGWLATQQRPDGSFPTMEMAQPGVTGLCALAFLAAGHQPGQGPHGQVLDKAVDYVLSCQNPAGLIARVSPASGNMERAQCAAYNHAIGGLMLSEIFGTQSGRKNQRIREAIEAALAHTLEKHPQPKRYSEDEGAWRYERPWQQSDADLSVTCWQLMFLRSARNAGFEVPAERIDDAVGFLLRCHEAGEGYFWYALRGRERVTTRGMTGAGVLSLSLGGRHQTAAAQEAGQWLVAHPFDEFNQMLSAHDRFFYGAFFCSHAMFQLGGDYWRSFYPILARTLVDHQQPDGAWPPESHAGDRRFGNAYTTAMAVLALSPPYQLLPILQR